MRVLPGASAGVVQTKSGETVRYSVGVDPVATARLHLYATDGSWRDDASIRRVTEDVVSAMVAERGQRAQPVWRRVVRVTPIPRAAVQVARSSVAVEAPTATSSNTSASVESTKSFTVAATVVGVIVGAVPVFAYSLVGGCGRVCEQDVYVQCTYTYCCV